MPSDHIRTDQGHDDPTDLERAYWDVWTGFNELYFEA